MNYTVETLAKGTKVCINSTHRFGTDAFLLSDFCGVKYAQTALDIGSGCGIIPLRWKDRGHKGLAVALEIDAEGTALTNESIKLNNFENMVAVNRDIRHWQTDMQFDAILSNPPYIAENVYKTLQKEIFFEPEIAFVGGDDGLEFYHALTAKYKNNLKYGGFIAYEIGYDQADSLCKIAEENGMSCQIIKDLGGNDRVSVLRKKQP